MSNKIVVLGGGVAAGYFAKSFVEKGFPRNTLTIVSADVTLPCMPLLSNSFSCVVTADPLDERPTLSKGYLVHSEIRRPQYVLRPVLVAKIIGKLLENSSQLSEQKENSKTTSGISAMASLCI